MKERIKNIDRLEEAINNEEKIVNENGELLDDIRYFSMDFQTGEVVSEIYIGEPNLATPRYVYKKLEWDSAMFAKVEVQDKGGCLMLLLAVLGLVHYENGREYRLARFTNTVIDEELGRDSAYSMYEYEGKMRHACFELQKETG